MAGHRRKRCAKFRLPRPLGWRPAGPGANQFPNPVIASRFTPSPPNRPQWHGKEARLSQQANNRGCRAGARARTADARDDLRQPGFDPIAPRLVTEKLERGAGDVFGVGLALDEFGEEWFV